MPFIGQSPASAALTSSDIADGIISNAKLAQDIISADTALGATPADTDEFLVSDAGTLKRMDYSHIKGGGKIGQVLQTVVTDTSSYATQTFADISGLTVDITPAATNSKILVMTDIQISCSTAYGSLMRLMRDTTAIYVGDAASSRGRASKGSVNFHAASNYEWAAMYLDSPNTTSATTYKLQWLAETGSTNWRGRNHNDADNAYTGRFADSITVMEVLA